MSSILSNPEILNILLDGKTLMILVQDLNARWLNDEISEVQTEFF